jgi:predicted PurR-regulated permease PerM
MIIVYLLFLGLLGIIVGVVVPMVVHNLITLVDELPTLVKNTDAFIRNDILTSDFMKNIEAVKVFEEWIEDSNKYITTNIDKWIGVVINNAINVTAILLKFLMGLILSIYMLNDKNKLLLSMRRINYETMPRNRACNMIAAAIKTNTIFKKFIIGKTFDSMIVGIISYIVFAIMNVPMALLLAAIVTITNMIPSIGPIIGAVPCVILTLLFNPIKAVWVLIYLIVVQQIDGLLLGPKILGDTLGMSPLLIIAGVFIGGGFFGIFGMFLGTTVLAAVRHFVEEYVEKKLDNKGIRII